MMDSGASPLKLYPMAKAAFNGQYDDLAILAALRTFVRRFFTQQFKRSAMPDGPESRLRQPFPTRRLAHAL